MFTLKTYFQKKLNINTDDDHDSQEYDNNDIIAVASSNMLRQQIHNCKAIYIQEEKKKETHAWLLQAPKKIYKMTTARKRK